jgi:hypothetical protein
MISKQGSDPPRYSNADHRLRCGHVYRPARPVLRLLGHPFQDMWAVPAENSKSPELLPICNLLTAFKQYSVHFHPTI